MEIYRYLLARRKEASAWDLAVPNLKLAGIQRGGNLLRSSKSHRLPNARKYYMSGSFPPAAGNKPIVGKNAVFSEARRCSEFRLWDFEAIPNFEPSL